MGGVATRAAVERAVAREAGGASLEVRGRLGKEVGGRVVTVEL